VPGLYRWSLKRPNLEKVRDTFAEHFPGAKFRFEKEVVWKHGAYRETHYEKCPPHEATRLLVNLEGKDADLLRNIEFDGNYAWLHGIRALFSGKTEPIQCEVGRTLALNLLNGLGYKHRWSLGFTGAMLLLVGSPTVALALLVLNLLGLFGG